MTFHSNVHTVHFEVMNAVRRVIIRWEALGSVTKKKRKRENRIPPVKYALSPSSVPAYVRPLECRCKLLPHSESRWLRHGCELRNRNSGRWRPSAVADPHLNARSLIARRRCRVLTYCFVFIPKFKIMLDIQTSVCHNIYWLLAIEHIPKAIVNTRQS